MNKGRRNRSGTVSSYTGRERDDVDVLQTGLLNLGNSCFYNTIMQSLSVTRPLAALIAAPPSTSPALLAVAPSSPTYDPDPTTLPSPLPISQALLNLLSTLSPQGTDKFASKKPYNPKALLRELSKKHEEYAQATQQDSHELLRHLIDDVFMEEVDLIKKLKVVPAPTTPSSPKKRRRMTLRAAGPAPPHRPTMHLSRPSDEPPTLGDVVDVPEDEFDDADDEEGEEESEESSGGSGSSSDSSESEDEEEGLKEDKPRPFIDSVFGGKLASVVICDECQHVSLTHEDFLDLSLSLKDDAGNRMRKRDRIKRSLQAGFFSKKAASSKPTSPSLPPRRDPIVSLSETEASASASEAEPDEDVPHTDTDILPTSNGSKVSRRKSLDPSHLRESRKPFWSTSSNGSKQGSSSRDPSPLGRALSVVSASGRHSSQKHTPKIPKPSPEHAAYVRKILATIPGSSSSPLPTQLRWAQPNKAAARFTATQALSELHLQSKVPATAATDLYECFVNFTAVEVLEGDNLYSCKQCWKLLNPEMVHRRRMAKEDRQRERRAKKRASAGDVGERLDDAGSVGTPHATSIASPGVPPFLELAASDKSAPGGGIPRSPTSSTSGDAQMGEGSVDVHLADAEDGSATDTSVETSSSAKLPLTKANVLALTPDTPNGPTTSATSATTATTAITTSLNRAASAASLSTRLSTSTRFSLPAPPPRAARHILRRAHKRYLISAPDLPPVLAIHFKRFQQTSQSSLFGNAFMNLKKREDFLSFPQEMDLTPFLAPLEEPPRSSAGQAGASSVEEHAPHHHRHWPGQRHQGPADEFVVGTARYRLYAVVVHHGNLREGHYTSYVLSDRYAEKKGKGATVVAEEEEKEEKEEKEETPLPRKWFFCSDELVRLCTLEEVLRSKAYMLFYERVPNVENRTESVQ